MYKIFSDRAVIRGNILNLGILLYLFAFAFYYIDPVNIRKVYYFADYLIIFIALFSVRNIGSWRKNGDIAIALAIFSLGILIWCGLNKSHDEYWNIYGAYKETAKILLTSGIIIFIISNITICFPAQRFTVLLIIAGFVTNIYMIYQGLTIQVDRIQVTFDRATIMAYIFTMTNIIMLSAVLYLKNSYRNLIFLVGAFTGMVTIAYTETRVALLAFPVLIVLLLLVHPRVQRSHLVRLCGAFSIIMLLSGAFFHQSLIARFHALQNDIVLYQNHNSVSSVGARLVMYKTGWQAGIDAPFGQSAQRRGDNIKQQVAADPALSGVLAYINVHMHNELIETFSLRGIAGVLTLLLLYAVLLLNAWRRRNLMQGLLTLAVITYGLSDVLFFSKEAMLVFSMALILSVLHQKIVIAAEQR